MNEVSANTLPAVVTTQNNKNFDNDVTISYAPKYIQDTLKEGQLERIPETDCVELGNTDFVPVDGEDPKMLCASMKMPNPQQVVEGIGVATTILVGLKSFVQALGDLFHTIGDNFRTNKQAAIAQKQYEAQMKEAA